MYLDKEGVYVLEMIWGDNCYIFRPLHNCSTDISYITARWSPYHKDPSDSMLLQKSVEGGFSIQSEIYKVRKATVRETEFFIYLEEQEKLGWSKSYDDYLVETHPKNEIKPVFTLEVNEWYAVKKGSEDYMLITSIEGDKRKGYGWIDGVWSSSLLYLENYDACESKIWVPIGTPAIKERLKKEIKKRGLISGVSVIRSSTMLVGRKSRVLIGESVTFNSNFASGKAVKAFVGSAIVFKDGEWATVVEAKKEESVSNEENIKTNTWYKFENQDDTMMFFSDVLKYTASNDYESFGISNGSWNKDFKIRKLNFHKKYK